MRIHRFRQRGILPPPERTDWRALQPEIVPWARAGQTPAEISAVMGLPNVPTALDHALAA